MLSPTDCIRAGVTSLLAALLLCLANLSWASGALLTGQLGRWLDTEATPELAELLSRHPKFNGEVVRIVSLDNGKPTQHISALDQAVLEHLSAALRRHEGVRLAWQEPISSCRVKQDLTYLLGVEINGGGAADSTVNIGMIDVAESIWVSGVSLNWRGRLNSAERMAMSRSVNGRPRGTITAPMPITDAQTIAELLQRNIQCTLPDGINGPVYIEPPQSADLNRIRGELQRQLTLTAQAAMATSAADAQWTIQLQQTPLSGSTSELVASLRDDSGSANQHLASVFVSGPISPADRVTETRVAAATVPLLSPLAITPAGSQRACKGDANRLGPCVEVTFELAAPAYLFVMTTDHRELNLSSCSRNIREAAAGPRKVLLRAPANQSADTDAGVYALAVEDRAAARAIARHLSRAPGACASESSRSMHSWLNGLDEILSRYPNTYTWEATHFAASAGDLVAL